MAPPASAAEPCPTPPLCVETDAHGTYNLSVPPLSLVALLYRTAARTIQRAEYMLRLHVKAIDVVQPAVIRLGDDR